MSPKDTDRVNPRLQRQYAWRLSIDDGADACLPSLPGGGIVVSEVGDAAASGPHAGDGGTGYRDADGTGDGAAAHADSDDEDSEGFEVERRQAFSQADEFADLVNRTWALEAPELQARVAPKIFAVAAGSSVALAALSISHPQSAVRLLRLLFRFFRLLGDDTGQQVMAICLPIGLKHPDTTELLVEVAKAGDWEFARWLGFPVSALTLEGDDLSILEHTRFTPRLCEILDDETASWESRELAAEWLLISCTLAGVPTLRRVLRLPHLGIRFRALAVLLHSFTPPAVTEEDLYFLLEDLFAHPPIHARNACVLVLEHLIDYPETLTQALTMLRPARGPELLLRILNSDRTSRALQRSPCNEDWALIALSAAYPGDAVIPIDSHLRRGYCWQRYYGVLATKRLAEPLARPRLLRAAMDGAPRVAIEARKAWEELYEVPISLEPSEDLVLELGSLCTLLTAPPSAQLRSRIAVLRSESVEVRQTMLEVLLGEAPDPEALVLILVAMADETLLFQRQRKKLPKDRKELCLGIYRRFGELGVRGLCCLAEQFSEPGGLGGLLDLSHLAYSRSLRKCDGEPLVALAMRRLQNGSNDAQRTALGILSRLGAPDAMRETLFGIVASKQEGALDLFAAEVLALRSNAPGFEKTLTARIEAAWAQRDWALVRRLSYAIPKRGRWPLRLVEELLHRWLPLGPLSPQNSDHPESHFTGAAEHWAKLLYDNQRIDDDWLDRGLDDCATREFVLATSLLSEPKTLSPRRRSALAAALVSKAHGGVAALESAVTLLRLDAEVVADDPRLLALLDVTRGEWRARLIGMMMFRQPMSPALLPHLAACVCTDDEEEAESISWTVHHHHKQLEPSFLQGLLPRIKSPTLLSVLMPIVDPPLDPKLYWQDRGRRRSQPEPAIGEELVADADADADVGSDIEFDLDDY